MLHQLTQHVLIVRSARSEHMIYLLWLYLWTCTWCGWFLWTHTKLLRFCPLTIQSLIQTRSCVLKKREKRKGGKQQFNFELKAKMKKKEYEGAEVFADVDNMICLFCKEAPFYFYLSLVSVKTFWRQHVKYSSNIKTSTQEFIMEVLTTAVWDISLKLRTGHWTHLVIRKRERFISWSTRLFVSILKLVNQFGFNIRLDAYSICLALALASIVERACVCLDWKNQWRQWEEQFLSFLSLPV